MITKKVLKVPLYPCKIEILIYDNNDEIRKFRGDVEYCSGFCDYYKDGYIRIAIKSSSKNSAIVHECEHAKNFVFKYIEYKSDINNDEVDAYLIGWIADKVTKLYNKHKSTENGGI